MPQVYIPCAERQSNYLNCTDSCFYLCLLSKAHQLYERVPKGLPRVLTHQSANYSHPMASPVLPSCSGPHPIILSQESGTKGGSPPLDWLYGEEREEPRAIPNVLTIVCCMLCLQGTHHSRNMPITRVFAPSGEGSPPAHWVFKYSTTVKIKVYSQGHDLD